MPQNAYATLSVRNSTFPKHPGEPVELRVTLSLSDGHQLNPVHYKLFIHFPKGLAVDGTPAALYLKSLTAPAARKEWDGGQSLDASHTPHWADTNSPALFCDVTPGDAGISSTKTYGSLGWSIKYKAKTAAEYDFIKAPDQEIVIVLLVALNNSLVNPPVTIDPHPRAVIMVALEAPEISSLDVEGAFTGAGDGKTCIGARHAVKLNGDVTPPSLSAVLARCRIGAARTWALPTMLPLTD